MSESLRQRLYAALRDNEDQLFITTHECEELRERHGYFDQSSPFLGLYLIVLDLAL